VAKNAENEAISAILAATVGIATDRGDRNSYIVLTACTTGIMKSAIARRCGESAVTTRLGARLEGMH
jgi:hypothetical protein